MPKKDSLYTPRLSPERRVLCFTVINAARERRTYLAGFSEPGQIPEVEWKLLTGGASVDERQPFWSPDGRFLYFLSERDGFRCIWAVRFDPASSKVMGEPFPAHHLHEYRHNLIDFGDVADIGLSLAGKTIFLAVREIQANI
jgi:eukaryotic-like serine/threonine-protein kinase